MTLPSHIVSQSHLEKACRPQYAEGSWRPRRVGYSTSKLLHRFWAGSHRFHNRPKPSPFRAGSSAAPVAAFGIQTALKGPGSHSLSCALNCAALRASSQPTPTPTGSPSGSAGSWAAGERRKSVCFSSAQDLCYGPRLTSNSRCSLGWPQIPGFPGSTVRVLAKIIDLCNHIQLEHVFLFILIF